MSFAPPVRNINEMSNGEMASYGDDRKLMVTFSRESMLMGYKSEVAGKPVYEDRDYITIVQPGAKSDMKRLVKLEDDEKGPSDPNRFPRQWAAFQGQKVQVADGLPLENWPPIGMSPASIKGFKVADIHTVEQLSNLSDANCGGVPVMDARKWRDLAIKYLDDAAKGAPISAMAAQLATLQQEMAILRDQNAALAANQKKTPGRKPSGESEEGE